MASEMDRCLNEVEVIERQNYDVPKDFEHVFSNIYSHMDRAIVTKSKPGKPTYYSEQGLMFQYEEEESTEEQDKIIEELMK